MMAKVTAKLPLQHHHLAPIAMVIQVIEQQQQARYIDSNVTTGNNLGVHDSSGMPICTEVSFFPQHDVEMMEVKGLRS